MDKVTAVKKTVHFWSNGYSMRSTLGLHTTL